MENYIKEIFSKSPELSATHSPPKGHEARFLEKLAQQNTPKPRLVWRRRNLHFLSVAAGIALLFGMFKWGAYTQTKTSQIQAIAPDAVMLTDQYSKPIANAIEAIKAAVSPLSKPHIDRALEEISKLEIQMKEMESDLLSGGNSKLIIQAMIQNYQTRLELLEEVSHQIETIHNLNKNSHENM